MADIKKYIQVGILQARYVESIPLSSPQAEGTWHTKTVQLKAESKRRSDCSLDGELESQLHDSSNKIQTAPTATRQLSH